jgi:hypothetical protein
MLRILPNDLFGIAATRESAFGESPIVLGLTQIGPRRGLSIGAIVVLVAR